MENNGGKSAFVLGSPEKVNRAYILAPLAGLSACWLCLVVDGLFKPGFSILRYIFLLPWLFIFGIMLCAIAQFLVVAPILAGFKRYRWKWVNRWSASIIGFLISALPVLAIEILPMRAHDLLLNHWMEAITAAIYYGSVGLVGGLVFSFIALEKAE